MAHPDFPSSNEWFLFPNGETVRINSIGEEYIEMQYSNGSFEVVDSTIWLKLGAEHLEPSEGWLIDKEEDIEELDFMSLGVTPGAEGADFAELSPEFE